VLRGKRCSASKVNVQTAVIRRRAFRAFSRFFFVAQRGHALTSDLAAVVVPYAWKESDATVATEKDIANHGGNVLGRPCIGGSNAKPSAWRLADPGIGTSL
jgi:hypothetical protein